MPRSYARLLPMGIIVALAAGCGGGGGSSSTPPPPPASTYTVGGTVAGLYAGTSVTLADNGSDTLTVSANGSFTFATKVASGGSYAVTVTGQPTAQACTLTSASGSNVTANVTGVTVTCATVPQYAYVLFNSLNGIYAYSIGTNGLLNSGSANFTATGNSPQSIAVDPTRHYVYVPNFTDDTVSQYVIQSNGSLQANATPTVAVCHGPDGLTVDPAGKNVYVICKTDEVVQQFAVNSDGTLTATAAAPVATGPYPWTIAVTPDGKYVYVTDHGSTTAGTTIDQYAVASDGSLAPLSPQTVNTGAYPTGFAIDASGTHLYVADVGPNAVAQYTIGSGGQLGNLSPATVAAGSQPDFIAIHPTGRFAYAVNYNPGTTTEPPGTVSQYTVGSTGPLSPIAGTSPATGLGPVWMSFDALGRYGYVLNIVNSTVSEYTVNSDGTLALQLEAGLGGLGANPYAMAISY